MSDREDVISPVRLEAELVIPTVLGAEAVVPVEVDVTVNCEPV